MMMNMFSMFDTSTNMTFECNWSSSIMMTLIYPYPYWLYPSHYTLWFNYLMNLLNKEFKMILNNKFNYLNSIYYITLFMVILINNFMGLFPYIFTSSSHMIFALSMALPLWLSLMMWGWKNNMNHMFSHMIPQSTPNMLMPFMVLIESISNIIRPLTLTIRLTANMIAGHILLTLLSQSASSNSFLMITLLITLIQMILLILEFSVSIIQSYVFSILSTLYTKEINYV
nr:ATP synthase F0 subunit 6 [Odontocolon albotibiale]